MKTLIKWGKMSKPTPVSLKGPRNFFMKIGALMTSAAGALAYFLKNHAKDAPVPDYAWQVVFLLGAAGIFCTAFIVPFLQSYYTEDASVSKK